MELWYKQKYIFFKVGKFYLSASNIIRGRSKVVLAALEDEDNTYVQELLSDSLICCEKLPEIKKAPKGSKISEITDF